MLQETYYEGHLLSEAYLWHPTRVKEFNQSLTHISNNAGNKRSQLYSTLWTTTCWGKKQVHSGLLVY